LAGDDEYRWRDAAETVLRRRAGEAAEAACWSVAVVASSAWSRVVMAHCSRTLRIWSRLSS
jgi:hypothetical protein